jgi:hypothetical protein
MVSYMAPRQKGFRGFFVLKIYFEFYFIILSVQYFYLNDFLLNGCNYYIISNLQFLSLLWFYATRYLFLRKHFFYYNL